MSPRLKVLGNLDNKIEFEKVAWLLGREQVSCGLNSRVNTQKLADKTHKQEFCNSNMQRGYCVACEAPVDESRKQEFCDGNTQVSIVQAFSIPADKKEGE